MTKKTTDGTITAVAKFNTLLKGRQLLWMGNDFNPNL